MSVGDLVVKAAITIGALAFVGFGVNAQTTAQRTYHNDLGQVTSLKLQYQRACKKRPTKKLVTTNYQKALDTANKYLALSNELHDQGDMQSKKATKLINQMNDINSDGANGPMVSHMINGWHGQVFYGGQNVKGKVQIAFKYTDDKGQVMQLVTCQYSPHDNQLSNFVTYVSKTGENQNRQSLGN